MSAKVLVDAEHFRRTINRIAHEVVERHVGSELPLAVVGIHTNGVPIARRIAALIAEFTTITPPFGTIDIGLYRDDIGVGSGQRPGVPRVGDTQLDFDVTSHAILLVDDVLYTGRTIRAAIDALFDYGRPPIVQLACLVDRGHRELPIRPDYVGKNLPTSRGERVTVRVAELEGVDEILLEREGTN
ncbi:MAG TPA: bifunctional pyr operon transcriptional regulator/uracil phosphoribosyltransferase PyrR [Miltoncostaeales bacterium]|jgi:pyrimidine operon attenuation protein/uracil phosphoribosyltransferase|nr:bifunctional pyr operon transcriptional regulator/uracil phosphoribosyltransferase PyrR [Miltoncostaeales bacterium]